MAEVMMAWRGFKFNIDSAAYNELVRTWQWRWNSQPRINQSDILQYTGKAAVKTSLNGEIATTLREVGTKQIDSLAKLGDDGLPGLLVSGLGDILGYWVMTDLSETNRKFIKGGLPRRQSFSLELSYYGDDIQNP